MQLYVDGVPLIDTTAATTVAGSTTYQGELFDDMAIQFGDISTTTSTSVTTSRPTGVIAISRKNSMAQQSLGLLDTGEAYLSTNPGTLVELNGAPWGTISNAPGTITAVIGQVVPTGAVIQGLPEL